MVERIRRGEGAREADVGGNDASTRSEEDANAASAARRGQASDVSGGGDGSARVGGSIDTTSFERWVQSALNAVGGSYGFGGLEVDGKLTSHTRGAVRAFQRQSEAIVGERLAVDGVAGPHTSAALGTATHSSAPTLREAQRARRGGDVAATSAPTTAGDTEGGSGPSADAQPSPADTQEAERPNQPGEPEVASGEGSGAAARLREERDGAATPGAPRGGAAGQADEIRTRFPGGVLVSLTIPDAYENPEAVIAEVAAQAKGHRGLDGYAYDVHRAAWADANPRAVDELWRHARRALGAKAARLPETYSKAETPRQRTQILQALKGIRAHNEDMKDLMWAAMPQAIARTVVTNNRYIPNSAQGYATQQRAAAGDTGALVLGKAMIYGKATTEIPQKVTATSAAVAAVLQAHAPAEGPAADQAARDAKAAKVRFLTISSHGTPGWMGGHGRASDSAFHKRDVPAMVGAMASTLAADVRVRLFACHTARTMQSQEHEGTIADAFRDELNAAGKTEGAVIGHTESGDTQRNSTTRFLHTNDKSAKADWRGVQVFTDTWIREYARGVGVSSLTTNQLKNLRTAMVEFFGRECWMEDITDMATLTASSRDRWRMRHPERRHIDRYLGGRR